MKKKEELHTLIHALSKSEKRYIKLFCKRESSGRNYLKLFDAIEAQKVYDERTIKEKFKDEKFTRQLHVTKNYLHKLILKSLRNFHTGISKDAELKDLLRNVEILYNKELYVHCGTELKKADTIASKYELLTGRVEVEGWKRKLEQAVHPHHYTAFQNTVAEQKVALHLLENSIAYWQLAIETSNSLFRENKSTIEETLLHHPDQALTLEAKVLYYNTQYLQYLNGDQSDLAVHALHTLITLLEEHPHRIAEAPGHYVSSVNNLVSYFIFSGRYDEGLKLIQKAKGLYNKWRINAENRTLLKQIIRTYNLELEIYRDNKSFHDKVELIESTTAFVKANEYKMPKIYLLSFWFQLASIHFMRKDFKQSLQWLNKLLNARFKVGRTDLQIQARMLNLIVHLEQQNLMVLRYYVDSTRRYMKKVKEVQPFEKILLRFFTKIGRLPLLEYKAAFSELKSQLFPSGGEALVPDDALGYIDYREWIDWKVST